MRLKTRYRLERYFEAPMDIEKDKNETHMKNLNCTSSYYVGLLRKNADKGKCIKEKREKDEDSGLQRIHKDRRQVTNFKEEP